VRPYSFPAHVYACAVQNQVVFLDLRRNRYLSTELSDLRGVARAVDGWPAELDTCDTTAGAIRTDADVQATLANLISHHLLFPSTERNRSAVPRAAYSPARTTLLEHLGGGYPQISYSHVLSFVKSAAITRYRLSVCSLYSTIRRIGRRRASHPANPQLADFPVLCHRVAVFRRLRPLLPPSKVPCLLSSLTLLEFLATYGYFPSLVFGVQAHPFSAHCWVQHADTVLNSTLEEVLTFTPIMVV
jgi:Transglutaminase-like superfamily